MKIRWSKTHVPRIGETTVRMYTELDRKPGGRAWWPLQRNGDIKTSLMSSRNVAESRCHDTIASSPWQQFQVHAHTRTRTYAYAAAPNTSPR